MKYKNLKELAAAFRAGELEGYQLQLDNDDSFLVYIGPNPHKPQSDEFWNYQDSKTDEARDWYQGGGYSDLQDAIEAAGIPCEWV